MKKKTIIYGVILLLILFAILFALYIIKGSSSKIDGLLNIRLLKNDSGSNVNDNYGQGIRGVIFVSPGACDNLERGCPLVRGAVSIDLKKFKQDYSAQQNESIMKSFDSNKNGEFEIGLPLGKYCVWDGYSCSSVVEITSGEWVDINLSVGNP
jgi:hypothetical protein